MVASPRAPMVQVSRSIALILLGLAVSCARVETNRSIQLRVPRTSLRALAHARGIQIGAAVAAGPLGSEPLYAETLAREFSMVTPENAMKFGSLCPSRGYYDFREADAIVDFAGANGMLVRGHTLVWGHQLPHWVTARVWTRNELIEILREHIMTVVGHYRGRVVAWDVVNEAVADDGSLTDSIWFRGIGPAYIEMAFRWAHEADPQAILSYNDGGGEGKGRKSEAIYARVQDLVLRGVPIHGVGFQMHLSLSRHPEPSDVAANMKRLAALGLQIHVTEMDVAITGVATPANLSAQARIYRDALRVCLSAHNCSAFTLWGFTDRYSWISQLSSNSGEALIFDDAYRPKPAYAALREVLGGIRSTGSEWAE